ncbi:MAG: methyltransferase [Micrococcales bacterium 73-13]|nr:MAG: methyltransferase [Micrococcales bacterium 73-13]
MSAAGEDQRYVEGRVIERSEIAKARRDSLEMGLTPISAATGALVAQIAAATDARRIIEIGTGLGVSALWLLSGAPEATLTSIDVEVEHQQLAREALVAAGVPAARTRLIAGRASEVLPRINDGSYDLCLVDADPASVIEYVEHALRITRPGGTVLVPHALLGGRVPNPVLRDGLTQGFRDLAEVVNAAEDVVSALVPIGDGLLLITKRGG